MTDFGAMESSRRIVLDGEEVPEELFMTEMLDTGDFSSLEDSSSIQSASFSQADADFALARALQQQEHAYLLLQIGSDGSGDYDASGSGNFDYDYFKDSNEEDDFHSPQPSIDDGISPGCYQEIEKTQEQGEMCGSHFEDDEAFARALQEAEQREATAYMMGLIDAEESQRDDEDGIHEAQEAWQDIDPDNMSYEELIALGEAVGTHSKGLKPNAIAALPCSIFSHQHPGTEKLCVICRLDYEDGDGLLTLPCRHCYHADCIKNWLQINKVCPICSAEVTL
ncbi:hypothetical protein GOP47_0008548 [Adiantum capillus-veneris]|uniref:RING-type domain-containing protein n=1 Tax=Adiantum capillus-veneris TaxID=13818 RepID=A0A9D4UYT8_ADICA|nr:hypothetical protein GOP47_0008548 [Adiantum capillus-veneris]